MKLCVFVQASLPQKKVLIVIAAAVPSSLSRGRAWCAFACRPPGVRLRVLLIRARMGDADADGLPEGWEAVQDDLGRTYWWNTQTDETSWQKPVEIKATSAVANGTCLLP
jgi:hypothetical protein